MGHDHQLAGSDFTFNHCPTCLDFRSDQDGQRMPPGASATPPRTENAESVVSALHPSISSLLYSSAISIPSVCTGQSNTCYFLNSLLEWRPFISTQYPGDMEYFIKLWKLIKRIWNGATVILLRSLPIWFIVAGIILFLLSYFFENDTIKSALKSAAIAVFNGGIFAALLKSMQFIGVFEESLKNILISKSYISSLGKDQLSDLLNSISKTAVIKGFPELSERMSHDMLHNFISKIGDFYYSKLSREITILSYDEKTDIIEISELFILEIKAHSAETVVPYKHNLAYSGDLVIAPVNQIRHFLIDDICHKGKMNIDPSTQDMSCEIVLTGKEKYNISRLVHSKFKLSSDPVIQMTGSRFTDGMSVRLNTVPGISADVYPVGFDSKFLRKVPTSDPDKILGWEVNTLFFPGDGLTIALTRP